MSNINELVLEFGFSANDIRSIGGQQESPQFNNMPITTAARNAANSTVNAAKWVGNKTWNYGIKPAGYALGGTAALGAGTVMGLNALADSGIGKGALGAGVAGAAAHYGGQYATQGLSNLAQYAADHGINSAVASNLAEWVPMAGNVVSAGTSMAAQHLINQINDEKDRLRGINPSSSFLGRTIKNGIAGAAGFLGGPIASAIQGLRAGWAQHSLDKLKQQQGYMNAANRNMMNQQQPNQMDQMNGY